jgi:hypothetical protein
MTITINVTGESLSEIGEDLRALVPNAGLDEMGLQELLLYVDQRCDKEGYEMEVYKKGERAKPREEQKRDEATRSLKEDLEASVKLGEEAAAAEPEKKGKKAAKGNGKAETDEERKARCVLRLQDLFLSNKSEVMKLLAEFGGGVKSFNAIAPEKFGPISDAIKERFP